MFYSVLYTPLETFNIFDKKQVQKSRRICCDSESSNCFDYPDGIFLLKVNNRNTRTRCEKCSKLTIKIPERRLASFWYLYC